MWALLTWPECLNPFFKLLLHESYKNTPVRVKKKKKQKEKDWNAQEISRGSWSYHSISCRDLHSQKTVLLLLHCTTNRQAWTFTFTGSRPQLLSSGLKSYWTVEVGGGDVSHGIKRHTLQNENKSLAASACCDLITFLVLYFNLYKRNFVTDFQYFSPLM